MIDTVHQFLIHYACKSPDQTSSHTQMNCQPGDDRCIVNLPQGIVCVCRI